MKQNVNLSQFKGCIEAEGYLVHGVGGLYDVLYAEYHFKMKYDTTTEQLYMLEKEKRPAVPFQ